MCYPKGAHSFTHRWLQLLTFGAFWIQFQIFNVLPQGGSFVTPPLGAITHFLGILDSVQNFPYAAPRELIPLLTVWGQLPTFGAFWIQFQIFNVLPQGGSFVGSPLAAITYFLGIFD